MSLVERHLFGPGPSNPYPDATAALAATASALTVAGMAAAHGGGDGKGHWGEWPFASGGKSLTYSETHLQDDGGDGFQTRRFPPSR